MRAVLGFFTRLELSKSQADSLWNQLAADWSEQYDTIAELIALQMIVYIDETGWKVGTKSCYTWVFSTTMHVLYRCGVSRAKTEATAVLGESFAGIGVTDDYAAYQSLFTPGPARTLGGMGDWRDACPVCNIVGCVDQRRSLCMEAGR